MGTSFVFVFEKKVITLLKVSHDGMSCEIIKLMLIPRKKSLKPHDGKSLIIRQKFDNVEKIDKTTKGE